MAESLQFVAKMVDKVSAPTRAIARSMRDLQRAQVRLSASSRMAAKQQRQNAAAMRQAAAGSRMAAVQQRRNITALRQTSTAARKAASSVRRLGIEQQKASRARFRAPGGGGGGGGGKGTGDGILGMFSGAALAAGWALAGAAVAKYTIAATAAIVKTSTWAQQARSALGIVSGSADEGAAQFEKVRATVVELGLEMQGTVAEFQRLRNVGFGGTEALEITRMTADLRALGIRAESVGSIMNAMGKIMAQGKLQGDELMMLAEAGVSVKKVYENLSKTLGVSIDEVKKMQQAGALAARPSIDAIKAAVLEVTGGKEAGDAARKIVESTVAGGFNQLKASFDSWMIKIGDLIMPTLEAVADHVRVMFQVLEGSGNLPELEAAIKELFAAAQEFITVAFGTDTLADSVSRLTTVLLLVTDAVRVLTAVWDVLMTAMKVALVLLAPVIVAAALAMSGFAIAAAALVTALYAVGKAIGWLIDQAGALLAKLGITEGGGTKPVPAPTSRAVTSRQATRSSGIGALDANFGSTNITINGAGKAKGAIADEAATHAREQVLGALGSF